MEIRRQFIVEVNGKFQILFSTDTKYFITTNGGFGQRDLYIEEISDKEAWELLEPTKKSKHEQRKH